MTIHFKNSKEYEQFIGLENVYFHIHETYARGGQRERHVTHFPLARMIARGDLEKHGILKIFKGPIILFCNAKFYSKRFDILAITRDKEILLIECKYRTQSEKTTSQALDKIGKATEQLTGYCSVFVDFASSINGNYIQAWSSVINRRYEKFGFPSFQERLKTVMGLENLTEQERWAKELTDAIKMRHFYYGLAINESPDGEVESYSRIPLNVLRDSIKYHWNKKYGDLQLFKVDHMKDIFEIF